MQRFQKENTMNFPKEVSQTKNKLRVLISEILTCKGYYFYSHKKLLENNMEI
jgi:hypothetical protein